MAGGCQGNNNAAWTSSVICFLTNTYEAIPYFAIQRVQQVQELCVSAENDSQTYCWHISELVIV